MKASLLFTLLLVFGFSLAAQRSLSIEPASTRKQISITSNDVSYEEVMKVEVKNTSGRRFKLRWDKVTAYQPYAWESQVCDKEASYPPTVTSNYDPFQGVFAPVVLEAGESFDLFFTVTPYNTTGQNKVDIVFRDIDRPETILGTASFQINLTDAEDTAKLVEVGNRIKVYPNPVHDRFFLTNTPSLARIDLYNTLGRKIRSYENPQPGDSFLAGDLPQGVYLLNLVDKNGKVVHTLRLLRRDFRP
ncbi:T9SS type A sorting domain-containing protein [Lewinella sp. LCG006]|uniref:T9SS type A sorting domain-containing protein n=1 Tax=Lewinella sp. LCG006 TaxID=3231911 RepID=UPI0034607FC4